MSGCHFDTHTCINSVIVPSRRTPTALSCCSVTLRQDSPSCPALMESTQRPSVRQPVSCDVVWVESWVGVMSQKSSDGGEATRRNLASISVCNRSPVDLHGPNPEISCVKSLSKTTSSGWVCVFMFTCEQGSQGAARNRSNSVFPSVLQACSNTTLTAVHVQQMKCGMHSPLSTIWDICHSGCWWKSESSYVMCCLAANV